MGFQSYVRSLLGTKKIEIKDSSDNIIGYLELLSEIDIDNPDLVEKFTNWRRKHMRCFLTWFEPTNVRTKKWLKDVIFKEEDRIFFKIIDTNNELIGHVGAIHRKDYIEYDNLIREGEVNIKGYAYFVAMTFMKWLFSISDTDFILGNCISSNLKALRLHEKTGFRICNKTPLKKMAALNNEIKWVKDGNSSNPELYHYEIRLYRKDFIGKKTV